MISSATIFRSLGEIASGPQALLWSKFRSSFFTPSSGMLMFLQSVLRKVWFWGTMQFKLLSSNSISGAEHRTKLVIEKLGLFFGVCNEFPSIFEWRDSHPLSSSCFDEAPQLLLGGGWICHVI